MQELDCCLRVLNEEAQGKGGQESVLCGDECESVSHTLCEEVGQLVSLGDLHVKRVATDHIVILSMLTVRVVVLSLTGN